MSTEASTKAAEQGHYEALYGGLDKIDAQLSPENRDQLGALTATEEDPQEARARMVNLAYLQATYPKNDPDAIAANWDQAKSEYAKQALGLDKPEVTDKELYAAISGQFQKVRDERKTVVGEGLGLMFDAFRSGAADRKQTFDQVTEQLKGKPGFDPARLDIYRHMADTQWNEWEQAGQHFPAAVEAIGQYVHNVNNLESGDPEKYRLREAALRALHSVPEDQQNAILGLAMRQKQTAPEVGGMDKLGNRAAKGIAETAVSSGRAFADLVTGATVPGGSAINVGDQFLRKAERKLDGAMAGQLDPNRGSNWLSEAVLGAAEGLPRMLAMFHPAGIAVNVAAFSEEARGHFEDAGVAPEKAQALGVAAAIPLTALMAVTSKTVVGGTAAKAGEAWLLRNIAGKTEAALAKGYVKNILAQGAENTALLYGVTVASQLTEPAIQSLGNLLDGTIPGVKWTGKDGELMRVAKATPQTLASLVPLIALGTGAATLRTRGAALELRTIQDRAALEALGLGAKPETIDLIMGAKTPEEAVAALQDGFKTREDNPAGVEALNAANANESPGNVALAADGGYTVKDAQGNPLDTATTPEMAAKIAKGDTSTSDQPLGIAANGRIGQVLHEGIGTAMQALREFRDLPQFAGFKQVLNRWVGDTQIGIMHTTADVRKVVDQIPDVLTRKAVGRWLDANGDRTTIEHHLAESTLDSAKREYTAALKLTPEQVKFAEGIREWFKQRFDRAVAAGVMDEARFREGYLTHLIERPFVQGGEGSKFAANLNTKFKYAKERTFPNLFELEKADFSVKTTDVAEIMARYDATLNKAILSRQLIKDLLSTKDANGEPLAVPLKGAIKAAEGDSKASFINNPRQKVVDQAQGKIDKLTKELEGLHEELTNAKTTVEKFDIAQEIKGLREDIAALRAEQDPTDAKLYRSIDHPALRKWWWIGKEGGKEVFMEGDIGLHPDIANHLENALGTSGLRQWYDSKGNVLQAIPKVVLKAIDQSNSFLKANLLGGVSGFHAVHEEKRYVATARASAVAPWNLPEIDPSAANVKRQVRYGLMLATPHEVMSLFEEGLGGRGSLVDKLPLIGKVSRGVSEYTFQKLIPKLKSHAFDIVYERNLETFKVAIESGQATKDQVGYLTAHQINARFGHQNYADMGRDPTLQHILQLVTLAPDFWESNIRNYGEVMQGLTAAKVGREPILAFATTAAALWITARVLNQALDDDWHHEEPFAVIASGRTYTMRNEVEDLWRMWKHSRQYVMGRLSPTSTAAFESLSGKNWRGENISGFEVFKNWVSKIFPMSLRFLPGIKAATDKLETGGGRNVSVFQQFLGSLGIQVSRHSALNEAYQLANDWNKAHGAMDGRGTYPVSKYQQLRYALEDKDTDKAVQEIANLTKQGEPLYKLTRGFKMSIFHSWTGSREQDAEFKDSLKPGDLAKVTKAEEHRNAIFDAYLKLLGELPETATGSIQESPSIQ